MHSRKIQGAALVVALSVNVLACSGDDDDSERDGVNGGSGLPPTAVTADGTRYFGNFPVFPGAGTSDEASEPLPDGMVCDVVPGGDVLIPEPIQQCFFDKNDPLHLHPAATIEQVLECVQEGDAVHLRLTFHPNFVDNTYGANAIGWSDEEAATDPTMDAPMMDGRMMKKRGGGKGHTFRDLVGSDHAELIVTDGDGKVVLQFKLDYVSEDPSSPSGYASLGVTDGEGEMIIGDAADIVAWMTSIDRNLNERGYAGYTVDSPATDALYTPNSATPEWDYRVVYEAWIDADAFGDAGFGGALIEFVHASPSKAANNTLEVEPGECPPPPCLDNDPDDDCEPGDGPPPPPPGCIDNDPDTFCGEGGSGTAGQGGTAGGGTAGGGTAGGGAGSGSGGTGSGGNGGDEEDPCTDDDPDTVCDEGGSGPGGDPQYCDDNPDSPDCNVD